MTTHLTDQVFVPLAIAILTVSDTRGEAEDSSGHLLRTRVEEAGHRVAAKEIVRDDLYQLRAIFSRWIADPEIQAILSTGGTGLTGRDSTPEAVAPLLDKQVEGFGELFRQVSFAEIGTSTVQSRAFAGLANGTFVFCLPGSPNAVKLALSKIIIPEAGHIVRHVRE
jgi:molybdenum cofactor biosynthesis protein B